MCALPRPPLRRELVSEANYSRSGARGKRDIAPLPATRSYSFATILNSVRRLAALPRGVLFEAIGFVGP